MGFDLYGLNPKNENGEYFHRTVWGWRPIWEFAYLSSGILLSSKEYREGCWNNGLRISEDVAKKLGEKLLNMIASGFASKIIHARNNELATLPLKECSNCRGYGQRANRLIYQTEVTVCGVCNGAGKIRDSRTKYPLSIGDLRDFAEFAIASGGFEIY